MEDLIGKSEGDVLLLEAGKDLVYGSSVHLDPITICSLTGAKLVLVMSGDDDLILDDLVFFKRWLGKSSVELAGIVINKDS